MDMEALPLKLSVGRDEDRISALPDELLLRILERLDLPEAVRAGAVSKRWRHLPHQLSLLTLHISRSQVETMDAFTAALMSAACPPADRNCECQRSRAIQFQALRLGFYLSAPHLTSIGSAVADVVTHGKTKCLEFRICPPPGDYTVTQYADFGEQFMSFSRACQVAFRWLTRLCLKNLVFGDTDVTDLITACDKLECLTLRSCTLVDEHSALKIDTPCSGLEELEFIHFVCARIELISVPKLRRVSCFGWRFENPPVRFDCVPELRDVDFGCRARTWQAPFVLSECLSRSVPNLSKLHLDFFGQMIWIQPEQSKQLTGIFGNLTDVRLLAIFPECDLSWTLFILEAAPALQSLSLSRDRHSCVTFEDTAEKTNVVWEPSKDLKHLNLKVLQISGFKEEGKVANYIRLVMKCAEGLKRIVLLGELRLCKNCNDRERKGQVDEARRRRVKEQLARGSSSSVELIIR